ncbi:MAG: hypothetical protein ACXWL2_04780 [Candidatus Chromulinivorax sp.]
MYKNIYFLVLFLLNSLAVFTQDQSRLTTVTKLHQMVDNLPMKKMDTQTGTIAFEFDESVFDPITLAMQPTTDALNEQANIVEKAMQPITKATEVFEKASCQRDINKFLYDATQALTQEKKDMIIRNFVDRYESCKKYIEKNK